MTPSKPTRAAMKGRPNLEAARKIGELAQQILDLAPVAGLYVGIKIEPARAASEEADRG